MGVSGPSEVELALRECGIEPTHRPFPVVIDMLSRRCIEVLEESRVSWEPLAKAFGVRPRRVGEAGRTLPYARQVQFLQAAAKLARDPLLGLRVGQVKLADIELIGQLALRSATVGDALRALVEFQALLTDGSAYELRIGDPDTSYGFTIRAADAGPCEQIHLIVAQGLLHYLRELAGPTFRPTVVVVGEVGQELCTEIAGRLRAPVSCGGTSTAIVFASTVLERRLPMADPRLAGLLRLLCERELAQWRERSAPRARIAAAVKACMADGVPSAERVAHHLGVTPAALQAQLKTLGTNHRDLVDGIRRNLAEQYLAQSGLALTEISQMLGYAEPAAFNHAFQRWTGMSPRKRRQSLLELEGRIAEVENAGADA